MLPIYDVMIIHAEVVSRERIFIICLFKLFGRFRQRVAHPCEIALLSLPFRINRVSRPDYWKLGSCPLYTLLQYVEARKGLATFSHRRECIYNTGEYLHKSQIRRHRLNTFHLSAAAYSCAVSVVCQRAVCQHALYMHPKHRE